MTVQELANRLGLTCKQINKLVERGVIPPPVGVSRNARYSMKHVTEYHAYMDIKHNNATVNQVVAYCRKKGISLADYVRQRETSIHYHGIGIA